MSSDLARHDELVRGAVERHAGVVFATGGDGFAVAFARAGDALACAVEVQRALGEAGLPAVRMGVHTGEAEERGGDYFGPALNRAARIMSLAHGGQVVISSVTEGIVRDRLPDEVRLVDLGEHRLSDLSRPERVFQALHPKLRREFPPLRSVARVAGNLPVQVTSFVGREEESERIAAVLEQARVVTLTGVGGVGKTRLASHVAGVASVACRYRDGCWLCELAAVRDPELVPDAVVVAFGVQTRQGLTVEESLLEFLRGKELLVVLDNCEHLLASVAQLVSRIEQTCPGVQVLATSREGLNVAGEWIIAVGSLPVAAPGADLQTVAACAAVRLFVERARAVRHDFALDHANADAVAQICRRVDGIALAIELAAARVTALSPDELAQRLDDRFRVLGGGKRSGVERHQTLRAAIDWSYELLDEAEQRLLDRLSVFAGGFTLDAAEAVAFGEGIEANAVVDLLAVLVARSLVIADTNASQTRYRLYETIRQYAQEQLDRHGDSDRVRHEHVRYYARYTESSAATHYVDHDYDQWDDEMEREADNVHAAFNWAVETQDVDSALRMLGHLRVMAMANVDLAFRVSADAAVALPGATEHPVLPAALARVAFYANQRDDQEAAVRRCDEALAAERRLGTKPDPLLWAVRAHIAMSRGALDEYLEYTEHVVTIQRGQNDIGGLALALASSAWARTFTGDPHSARGNADEAIALARQVGQPSVLERVFMLTAHSLANSEPDRALTLLNEGIDLVTDRGRPDEMEAGTWGVAGHLASRLGKRSDALRYFARAIRQFHHAGALPVLGPLLRRVGDLLVPDDPEAAAILHGAGDTGFPSPHIADEHRQAVAALDLALGPAPHHELNDRGKALTQDHAVAFALDVINRIAGPDDETRPFKPHE
jgi:predicted ATPase